MSAFSKPIAQDPGLTQALAAAKERVNGMTDEERSEMMLAQRESWCVGELMMDDPTLSKAEALARCRGVIRLNISVPIPITKGRTDRIIELLHAAELALDQGDFSNGVVHQGIDEGDVKIGSRLSDAIRAVQQIDFDEFRQDIEAGRLYRKVQDVSAIRRRVLDQYQPLLFATAALPAIALGVFATMAGQILTLPVGAVVAIAWTVVLPSLIPFFAVSWQAKRSFRKKRNLVLNG
jgi:hypothetical protein